MKMSSRSTPQDETIRCVSCKKELRNINELQDGVQPIDGLAFHTRGHYGSGLYDPMDSTSLHLAICDECVEQAINDGHVVRFTGSAPRGGTIARKEDLG